MYTHTAEAVRGSLVRGRIGHRGLAVPLQRGTPAVHQASLVLFPEIVAPSASHRAYENRRPGAHVGEPAIPQCPQVFSSLESTETEAARDRKNEGKKGCWVEDSRSPEVGSGTSPARTVATLALESFQSSLRRKTLLHQHYASLNPSVSKQTG